ncbi:MAG: ABC transporter ATP-binding protein [Eubacteriales bacterium]|nr:ABC transporter ATP-binding protein [Eubacteriales bacterium]
MSEEPILRLEGLSKDYGQGMVLHSLDLDIYPGEFLTLLGPSGCGKTTTLRLIAGLEQPTSGRVFLEGVDMTDRPPEKRPVNTVFQSYALFPHMNVFQNIAYGLKTAGVKKAEQKQRVEEALALVRLSGYEKRMPSQLSGGQRQRVAIARAVVLKPKVLLLDEPLGALDLKLRQEMQAELKRLQQQLKITFVYITHDQEEALNMSSRIIIIREGRIEQIGTPEEVYEHPKTLFAASFIGQSNLLRGTVSRYEENGELTLNVMGVSLPALSDEPRQKGERLALCLRPQRVRYGSEPQHGMNLQGIIREKTYSGGMQHTLIGLNDKLTLNAITQASELDSFPLGSMVYVGWSKQHAPLVPDSELNLDQAEGVL